VFIHLELIGNNAKCYLLLIAWSLKTSATVAPVLCGLMKRTAVRVTLIKLVKPRGH